MTNPFSFLVELKDINTGRIFGNAWFETLTDAEHYLTVQRLFHHKYSCHLSPVASWGRS